MSTIYILKLEKGRYYVGKTDDVKQRYEEHCSGNGSTWTRKYRPISIEREIPNTSPFEEDKVTKEYMHKYGRDNVRGGAYVTDELDDFQHEVLDKETWAATNKCTRCGRPGHFVNNCYANMTVNGHVLNDYYSSSSSSDDDDDDDDFTYGNSYYGPFCTRCKRSGHSSSSCYARTDINGHYLSF